MQITLTLRERDGLAHDVRIVAPDGASVGDIAALTGRVDSELDWWSGSRLLRSTTPLGSPGLRDGSVIGLGGPGDCREVAGSILRLDVVNGPMAGDSLALTSGMALVGRGRSCDLTVTDPDVSRHHLEVTLTSAGIGLRDLGSANGSSVGGHPIDGDGTGASPGDLIRIGESTLRITNSAQPAASIRSRSDGRLLLNRRPRLDVDQVPAHIDFPAVPKHPRRTRVQWLAVLAPLAAAGAMAMLFHSPHFLAFALLSPIVMLSTAAGDRISGRRSSRRARARFAIDDAMATEQYTAALRKEVVQRRDRHPDPAALARTAAGAEYRLWERRRGDSDFLDLRLGLGSMHALTTCSRDGATIPAPALSAVPVEVNPGQGAVGLVGNRTDSLSSARWLICQLATLHSPADVSIVVLGTAETELAWSWLKWLPHLRGRPATEPRSWTLTIDRLSTEIARRRESGTSWAGPRTVVIIDRAEDLAGTSGLAALLRDGPAVGIGALCIATTERGLPQSCVAVVTTDAVRPARCDLRTGADPICPDLVADRVSSAYAERISRSLAPLRDAAAERADAIPLDCRLVDVADVARIDGPAIAARWTRPADLRVPLGVGSEGVTWIDLVTDGPHALIAGTTGAGKSELLQSLVLGLALLNSPERLSLILVDYKGGAAFGACALLPHTAGLVTDLDHRSTSRALRSLRAELKRRETVLAARGVVTIDELDRRAPADGLGRLVIVVDEFAALAEELPDFLVGLIGIAQRGRSLGVHLVLATQRPGTAVSPEIRANTSLRIALRVTDPHESVDVIGTDAASRIAKDQAGRAFARTASGLVEFQVARSGGARTVRREREVLQLDSWLNPLRETVDTTANVTDADWLSATLAAAATASALAPMARPWLEPLSAQLNLSDLVAAKSGGSGAAAFGLIDDPDGQLQSPLHLDLDKGAVLVCGAARSGRSTALRAIATAAAWSHTVDRLHIHGLDWGGGGLSPIMALPNCGTVTGPSQPEVALALLDHLNRPNVAGRRTLLLVDGWDSLTGHLDNADTMAITDLVLQLIANPIDPLLTVAVAGGRSALTSRLNSLAHQRILLRLSDPVDVGLAGLSARDALGPESPPGRGQLAPGGLEVQIADPGEVATRLAVQQVVSGQQDRPLRLQPLPSTVSLRQLRTTEDCAGIPAHSEILLGIGGPRCAPVRLDLEQLGGRFVVAGPPRSGRTSTVALIAAQLDLVTTRTAVIAGKPKELWELIGRYRDATRNSDRAEDQDRSNDSGVPRLLRPSDLIDHDLAGVDTFIIDDAEMLQDTAIGDALTTLARSGGRQWLMAGRTDDISVAFRGLASELKRARVGVLLQPGPGDGEALGLRLQRRPGLAISPGRGVLVEGGRTEVLQIARI